MIDVSLKMINNDVTVGGVLYRRMIKQNELF